MLFCCLWRNVETSCHKHLAVLSRHQQTPLLTTSEVSQLEGLRAKALCSIIIVLSCVAACSVCVIVTSCVVST